MTWPFCCTLLIYLRYYFFLLVLTVGPSLDMRVFDNKGWPYYIQSMCSQEIITDTCHKASVHDRQLTKRAATDRRPQPPATAKIQYNSSLIINTYFIAMR